MAIATVRNRTAPVARADRRNRRETGTKVDHKTGTSEEPRKQEGEAVTITDQKAGTSAGRRNRKEKHKSEQAKETRTRADQEIGTRADQETGTRVDHRKQGPQQARGTEEEPEPADPKQAPEPAREGKRTGGQAGTAK